MPKQSKGPPLQELLELRGVLASNLRAYMVVKYGDTAPSTVGSILEKTGVIGKNTFVRALDPDEETDVRLDTVVRLAKHFGCRATDLLQDYGARKARKRTETSTPEPSHIAPKGALQRRRG